MPPSMTVYLRPELWQYRRFDVADATIEQPRRSAAARAQSAIVVIWACRLLK